RLRFDRARGRAGDVDESGWPVIGAASVAGEISRGWSVRGRPLADDRTRTTEQRTTHVDALRDLFADAGSTPAGSMNETGAAAWRPSLFPLTVPPVPDTTLAAVRTRPRSPPGGSAVDSS